MSKKYEINQLTLGALTLFKNHPSEVIQGEELNALSLSVRVSGVLVPAVACPVRDRYELLSGH